MKFRKDINGLRAIAVIAVVLFHFNAKWMPGGFAGVDVFFVISGFLMTGIIFKGLENDNFSLTTFYVARANRIIPALAILCFILLIFGWFYLTPIAFQALGKHVASSVGFVSNIIYWFESGYFDTASHDKWLLHTWSLSAEWQFYLIYPVILVLLKYFISLKTLKRVVLGGSILGFIYCIFSTYQSPSFSYFLLPARIWEMTLGGVAYLYPFTIAQKHKAKIEWIGILLILSAYAFISEENHWPGYLAGIPVIGAFIIIQAQNNSSYLLNSLLFQKIGKWSYSIYLWHWPFVVAIYTFSLSYYWTFGGIALSILLGYLSHTYIERIKFKNGFSSLVQLFRCKPLYMVLLIGMFGSYTYLTKGMNSAASSNEQVIRISSMIHPSPYRDKCHSSKINDIPVTKVCTYFNNNVAWATIGDSHSVELAYALAEKLNESNGAIKQYSYSACPPSYLQQADFSNCAKWTNDVVTEVMDNNEISHVLINYRYSWHLFGENLKDYPDVPKGQSTDNSRRHAMLTSLDNMVRELAKHKEQVVIFKPIPELGRNINSFFNQTYIKGGKLIDVKSETRDYYDLRNEFILEYFLKAKFPNNVTVIDPTDVYCDQSNCFAIKNSIPLYFDYDHPSVAGAKLLVDKMDVGYASQVVGL